MALNASSARALSNGLRIPMVGYGVYELPSNRQTTEMVKKALEAGYRHIDTAAMYHNETETGLGIRESGIPREEIFVTTKLDDPDHGFDRTLKAFRSSLQKLGLDYVDLYLIHSPHGGAQLRTESWRAMEQLHDEGLIKSLGVSNYGVHHLEELLEVARIKPVVNQIEIHPWLDQARIVDFCQQHEIVVEAYSPLARAEKADDPTLKQVATKYGKTWAQILIRWSIQRGYVPLTKTAQASRLPSNLDVFNFAIVKEDMETLNALNEDLHLGKYHGLLRPVGGAGSMANKFVPLGDVAGQFHYDPQI
ncbi:hypothetical protein IWQ60_002670 [Tieghemiomyces parasiticus]|uniref:NADP-dependent oxidoreductase domain-containing protein n=1 Tax=Tieghemiomyces parasiticus TaxID=78921 RepID=A0A9W8DX66_9FUNG|nr:hypothetical protein IWQ60_002670 [Tieghemiomyces parasiticus]